MQRTKTCQCGDSHQGKIACNDNSQISAILECNCVTYDGENSFLGSCFYNCESHYGALKLKHNMAYQQLPEKTKILLNLSICTSFHRIGRLCGDCEEGHKPLVLSYNLSCVRCPDGNKNW